MSHDPIDQVIQKLDQILEWSLENESRAGYFAALYRRVTRTVRDKIGTDYFDDDARMERLDVTFASRYLTAFEQWQNGDSGMSQCWQVAFDALENDKLIILQHLLVGMNAHIDYDLGIATAEVAGDRSGLASLHDDFDKINTILHCLIPAVFDELGALSPMIHLLEDVDEGAEEDLVGLVMDVGRDFAWVFAHLLVGSRHLPERHQKLLDRRDQEASWIGREIVDPGKLLDDVILAIRVPESKDVRHNIEVLAKPTPLPESCTG